MFFRLRIDQGKIPAEAIDTADLVECKKIPDFLLGNDTR